MKLAVDAKRIFFNRAGLGNYSRYIVNSVSKYLSEEDGLLLYTPRKGPLFTDDNILTINAQLVVPAGIGKFFRSVWRTYGIADSARKSGVQIFHGLSNELPSGLAWVGIRSVVTMHDVIFMRYPSYYKWYDRLMYQYKTKQALLDADMVVAISEQTKQDLIQFFGAKADKIKVIYQDCDPIFQQSYAKEELEKIKSRYHLPEKYVLSVATVEKRKNQLLLVKALKNLPKDTHLVLVGKHTNYVEELKAYINKEKLTDRVLFLPNIAWLDLPLIYQQSRVFAYVSRFEGFGIPLVEAMNTGVPIVTSTGSCFGEVCGDAAVYVDPNDDQQLAKELMLLLDEGENRNAFIQKGKDRAQVFRPENNIPQLLDLYKQLL